MKILVKFNIEKNYEKIIKYTLPIIFDYPEDNIAYYCLGMAYIEKGDKSTGLKYLQTLINKSVNTNNDNSIKLSINHVIVQVLEIMEFSLHGGDVLGEKTIHMIRDINKLAQELGDNELTERTERILNRWWHTYPSKPSIIALIPDSPLTLQVEPTNACNLNCTMCPRSKMKRDVGYMEPSIFDEMLDSWTNKSVTIKIKHLIFGTTFSIIHGGSIKLFFMGEPLLHPKLNKLIESANGAGCKIGLQTNGVALANDKVRRKLLLAKPDVIGISLDGIDVASYESVRNGSNWAEICRGLAALSREREEMGLNKKIWIMVSSIIPKWDQSTLERSKRFLKQISSFVDHIGFIPLSCERDPEFFDEKGKIISYSNVSPNSFKKQNGLCTEPFTKLNVLWDGTITACCYDINGDMPLGHVREGIDNVWKSSKMNRLQNDLLNNSTMMNPLCTICMGNK